MLASAAAAVCLMVDLALDSDHLQYRISMATAYAALAFLAASLALGPLRVLGGRHSPANTYLRRDVGIWAGVLALAHVAVGLTVHFPGRMWTYFLDAPPSVASPLPFRLDGFGMANYAGLASALVLILLLALSNDRALRALGTRRWKRFQRWNYVAFCLMVGHGILYQLVETRSLPWVGTFAVVVAAVAALQVAGFISLRRRHGS